MIIAFAIIPIASSKLWLLKLKRFNNRQRIQPFVSRVGGLCLGIKIFKSFLLSYRNLSTQLSETQEFVSFLR